MQGPVPVHRAVTSLVLHCLGGYVVKTLRPKEESPVLVPDTAPDSDGIAELGVVVMCGEAIVQGAPFWVEAVGDGYRFQEGGLPGSVLSDEECHRLSELKLLKETDGTYPGQVRILRNLVPVNSYAVNIHVT